MCEEYGGERLDLRQHMEKIWKTIGFKPRETDRQFEDDEENAILEDINVKTNNGFTPHLKKHGPPPSNDPYIGISVRNLPPDVKKDDVEALLSDHGFQLDLGDIQRFRNTTFLLWTSMAWRIPYANILLMHLTIKLRSVGLPQ